LLETWTRDPDPAVRRLVSEGSRPRLPWGERLRALQQDPGPMLPLLAILRDDPDESVRRSVANHLNDLSKDHPDLLVELCRRWLVKAPDSRRALVKHALRSLVKAGHAEALALLGAGSGADLRLIELVIETPRVLLGQALGFRFELQVPPGPARTLVIDYALTIPGARGQARRKVFKLSTLSVEGGRTVARERNHSMRPVTTRVYYEGECELELLANGHCLGRKAFHLRLDDSGERSSGRA
jgi:3-methyladenine DNA glycosylase AlkC